jgi:hypothetical protein
MTARIPNAPLSNTPSHRSRPTPEPRSMGARLRAAWVVVDPELHLDRGLRRASGAAFRIRSCALHPERGFRIGGPAVRIWSPRFTSGAAVASKAAVRIWGCGSHLGLRFASGAAVRIWGCGSHLGLRFASGAAVRIWGCGSHLGAAVRLWGLRFASGGCGSHSEPRFVSGSPRYEPDIQMRRAASPSEPKVRSSPAMMGRSAPTAALPSPGSQAPAPSTGRSRGRTPLETARANPARGSDSVGRASRPRPRWRCHHLGAGQSTAFPCLRPGSDVLPSVRGQSAAFPACAWAQTFSHR